MRVVQLFASVLLVAFASASLTTTHRQSKLTSDNFGSYVVTCNETHATFMNFASQGCNGAFTEFSSELNGCGEEFILPLGRNLSWNAVCNATHMQYSNYFNTQCQKPGLLVRTYNLDACYECPNKECKDDVVPPPNRFGPLQRNAPWIENQWHVAPGVLLASSMSSGSVYKIEYNATGDCVSEADCQVKSTPWITGFKSVSGLSYDAQSKTAFALAVAFAPVELNLLISFGLDAPEIYSVIQVAPAPLNLFGNLSLNGLARHDKDKSIFYATNLGNFSGDQGTIIVIDTAVGTWNTFAANLTAADGCFVFNGRLYVSEVFSATVHVFDVSNDTTKLNPVQITSYVAPGLMSLDDFFVTADEDGTATIYGADWVAGRVASWAADGSSNTSSIHAAGLQHPTSVRPELDARGNWQSAYVTVSQGGDYPVVNRQVNGGNVFRLKVRELKPFKAPGSLIQVTCTDSECKDCTATDTMIEQCIPTATGSMYITCGLLNVTVQQYTTSTCSGTSTSTTSGALTCSASGTGSFIQICAKL